MNRLRIKGYCQAQRQKVAEIHSGVIARKAVKRRGYSVKGPPLKPPKIGRVAAKLR